MSMCMFLLHKHCTGRGEDTENAYIGIHSETGVGVGCICSSSSGELENGSRGLPPEPGSRKEKKLCDMECLWWCPLFEVDDEDGGTWSSVMWTGHQDGGCRR